MVADQVVEVADQLWHDRINSFLKVLQNVIASGVSKGMGG